MKIDYANEKSDRIAKKDGTFVPKDRRKKRELEATASAAAANSGVGIDGPSAAKKMKLEGGNDGSGVEVQDPSSLVPSQDENASGALPVDSPPSNILFADALPKDCNEMMLACLFRSYQGYKEVRIPRTGLAFIEFDDEPHASVALKALDGFKLSNTETLNLKYGKS